MESLLKPVDRSVSIDTPARLHMGFLDLNGNLGRHFGGLGLTIEDLSTHITVTPAIDVTATGPSEKKAVTLAMTTMEGLGIREGVAIEIHKTIPEHTGLGSGTQLALAISTAIARLYDVECDLAELARLTERGNRSGIGIGSFETGGFIVDGGRGEKTEVPPVLFHNSFPESWRLILVFDNTDVGLNGTDEKSAFREIPSMTPACSGHLCRLLMMQVLPALAEEDFELFSQGITEIQRRIGDYFARYQGGRYSSDKVAQVLEWLDGEGVAGHGQSSWGPTSFALFENELEANRMLKALEEQWSDETALVFQICKARNLGADIEVNEAGAQSISGK